MFTVGINLSCILNHIFLINGLNPVHNNCLLLGSWYIGTTFVLYLIFPLIFIWTERIDIRKKRQLWWLISVFVILSQVVISSSLVLDQKLLINSFYYYSVLNQVPCFYLGILLYFQVREKEELGKYTGITCVVKMFIWFLIFVFFFWLRDSLWLSASIVCVACGRAFYWLWIMYYNYEEKWKLKNKSMVWIMKSLSAYGEVSYYAFLIHWLYARNFTKYIQKFFVCDSNITYLVILFVVWILTYWTAVCFSKVMSFFTQKIHYITELKN